jgi:plasmid stabilization system protein ParE
VPAIYGFVWQDLREARVRQFRYLVYYVVFADRIEVMAVMHGSWDAST